MRRLYDVIATPLVSPGQEDPQKYIGLRLSVLQFLSWNLRSPLDKFCFDCPARKDPARKECQGFPDAPVENGKLIPQLTFPLPLTAAQVEKKIGELNCRPRLVKQTS